MATGIISIATYLLGMTLIAWTLLIVNLIAYSVLVLLSRARSMAGDFRRANPQLTVKENKGGLSGACCVNGAQCRTL
jgi:hypothetical protein